MVQYRTFKLGLTETSSERLNSFLRQNTVIAVDKQFVPAGTESFFAILVEFDAQTPATSYDRSEKVDYAQILSEQQFLCFNELVNEDYDDDLRGVLTTAVSSAARELATEVGGEIAKAAISGKTGDLYNTRVGEIPLTLTQVAAAKRRIVLRKGGYYGSGP